MIFVIDLSSSNTFNLSYISRFVYSIFHSSIAPNLGCSEKFFSSLTNSH